MRREELGRACGQQHFVERLETRARRQQVTRETGVTACGEASEEGQRPKVAHQAAVARAWCDSCRRSSAEERPRWSPPNSSRTSRLS